MGRKNRSGKIIIPLIRCESKKTNFIAFKNKHAMKRLFYYAVLLFISVFISVSVYSNEGMWLPQLLGKLNEKEMKSLGMKISASDIYSINSGSLKDAIVSFGGFCTGEVISMQGLVLTNHHCGFGSVQNHSTLDHNYIRDGFWAMNNGEELPNQRLFVTFIVRIDDVTKEVMKGISDGMDEENRQAVIDKNINSLKGSVKKESYQDAFVRGFFENNQYYMFVTETYRDVRLVGAPPSAIGNFGKDTDNWIWPRHTGDFSLFRIYADKNNRPAAFSPDNVPYKPKKALAISLNGVKEGDFTMVFGFPGRTNEYLHSEAVRQVMDVNDPVRIAIRDQALSVIDAFMRRDEQLKIMYASKWAGISNSWKKWQGEVLGLKRTDAVGKKKAYEAAFQKKVNASAALKAKYGSLLGELEVANKEIEPYSLARDYFNEIAGRIELFTIASQISSLVSSYDNNGAAGFNQRLPGVKEFLTEFYSEYSSEVDQKLFAALMKIYASEQQPKNVSPLVSAMAIAEGGDYDKLAEKVFSEAGLQSMEGLNTLLEKPVAEAAINIKNNIAVRLFGDMLKTYQEQVQENYTRAQNRINGLQRTYMKAQMEVFPEKRFYPDANSTMRVTYGNVRGYEARDAVSYDYYTYLDGVMEKYVPGDYEFDVPEKLIQLYKEKDYGPYASGGKLPVCFIASNHTTGGNSGSPALDAYGRLVGLNFDRVWEGTMSDINYDPSICRNIMVDIRYVLFLIDKFANAKWLIKEMNLVKST